MVSYVAFQHLFLNQVSDNTSGLPWWPGGELGDITDDVYIYIYIYLEFNLENLFLAYH